MGVARYVLQIKAQVSPILRLIVSPSPIRIVYSGRPPRDLSANRNTMTYNSTLQLILLYSQLNSSQAQ